MSAEVTSAYCEAPTSGELIQGELLGPIAHVIPQVSLDVDVEVPSGPSRRIRHDLAFVMTSDCDLLSDFLARTAMTSASDLDTHPSALYGVTLVEAHLAANAGALRKEIASGKVMTRLKDNQIERYHYLEACSAIPAVVAPLFIDFRKSFVVPCDLLYADLGMAVKRLARLQSPFLYDVMHRFYGYASRIGVPELGTKTPGEAS